MKKNNKKGFTIVELVIVIAVIAILAAVLIPTFSGVIEKANKNSAMQAARNEYELYLAEHATEISDDMNLVIVSGEYEFDVVKGQFNAEAKAKGTHTGDDLSKAYRPAKTGEPAAYKWDVTLNKYIPATEGPTHVQYDLGNAGVEIYAN